MEVDESSTQIELICHHREILGRGGFATVFKGELRIKTQDHVSETKVPVAIKRIERAVLDLHPQFRERELEQMKLDHTNVVKLLHVNQDENFVYIALELCEASLDKVFLPEHNPKKYRGPPLPSDIDCLLQLSNGLEYIHNKHLVHRDIKPENVLIHIASSSSEVVVLKWGDFGLSKATTKTGNYDLSGDRGTTNYLAPETLKALSETRDKSNSGPVKIILNATSDVFACGIVFFKWLTKGVHPFGSEPFIDINNYFHRSNPINLTELPSNHFSFKIIKKMLSIKPEDRPNMREITLHLTSLWKMQLNLQLSNTDAPNQERTKRRKISSLYDGPLGIDEANDNLQRLKTTFHRLCSIPNPNESQISELNQFVSEDAIGLVNLVDKNGHSPLLLMCRENQCSTLRRCITSLSNSTILDVNYQDRNGFNALHYLCMNYQGEDFAEILKHLINLGIDVNRTDHELDRNALQLVLKHSNGRDLIYIVQRLIEKNIDLKHKHIHGWTALHYLCRHYTNRNLFKVAELLIDHGANVNEKDSDQWTALHVLCRSDHNIQHLTETIQVLISNGIELNSKNSAGWTAFHTLVRYYTDGNLNDVFELLIKNGADVNEKESVGWTVLHILCRSYVGNDLIDLIRLLISNGADVNAKTSDGCTALHFLSRFYTGNKLIELVRLLIENGADINAKKISDGWTTLHFLCQFYSQDNLIELIELLIKNGVEINVHESKDGWTPLHMLCAGYQYENMTKIMQLLVKNGVGLYSKMSDGTTPLDLLIQRKEESHYILEVIQLFDSMKERV